MGRLRESPLFLLRLTSGDQHCRPRPEDHAGKEAPEGPARRDRAGLVVGRLLPVPAAGPGPDEGVAFPFLVGEQVGEDRGGEGGIVQLQAQIAAAFVGAAGPCGAEFNPSEVDAVVGGVVVGPAGFRHQTDVAGRCPQPTLGLGLHRCPELEWHDLCGVHHIRYTGRLAQADIDATIGTVCDSYDNALAETINGLYKTEVIYHLEHGNPWRRSNGKPSDGWTDTTINTCWHQSATDHQLKRRKLVLQARVID